MIEKGKKASEKTNALESLRAFHIEADRTRSGVNMLISGIIGISDFSDQCIALTSHGGRIRVEGDRLLLTVYENNTVKISGKVEEISFGYGKNR